MSAKFYKLTTNERVSSLIDDGSLDVSDTKVLQDCAALPTDIASHMVENQIGIFPVPLGLAEHFCIDGKHYRIPMASEEPSVIAAAGNAAQRIARSGGFHTQVKRSGICAQIVFQLNEPVHETMSGKRPDEVSPSNAGEGFAQSGTHIGRTGSLKSPDCSRDDYGHGDYDRDDSGRNDIYSVSGTNDFDGFYEVSNASNPTNVNAATNANKAENTSNPTNANAATNANNVNNTNDANKTQNKNNPEYAENANRANDVNNVSNLTNGNDANNAENATSVNNVNYATNANDAKNINNTNNAESAASTSEVNGSNGAGNAHIHTDDVNVWQSFLNEHRECIETIADQSHPTLKRHGGGLRNIRVQLVDGFLEFDLMIDPGEAMGANTVNTIAEAVAQYLKPFIPCGDLLMAILSNRTEYQRVRSWARIDVDDLATADMDGLSVARRIETAARFAQVSELRAATHNKGIMNGINAVVLATGNDTRNVNAAAYADVHDNHRTWTTWNVEGRQLVGEIDIPMPIGAIGGAISTLPMAKLSMKLLHQPNAEQLMGIIASVGLASNLSAMRALVTKGIQAGHMNLQLQSLAMMAGAQGAETEKLVMRLREHPRDANLDTARRLLNDIRVSTTIDNEYGGT